MSAKNLVFIVVGIVAAYFVGLLMWGLFMKFITFVVGAIVILAIVGAIQLFKHSNSPKV